MEGKLEDGGGGIKAQCELTKMPMCTVHMGAVLTLFFLSLLGVPFAFLFFFFSSSSFILFCTSLFCFVFFFFFFLDFLVLLNSVFYFYFLVLIFLWLVLFKKRKKEMSIQNFFNKKNMLLFCFI